MSDRFPLIVNSETSQIEELSSGDNLNLSGNNIVNAEQITAQNFNGNLTGTATTSNSLLNAANIITGTISPERLSGNYNINVSTAQTSINLLDAGNILGGTLSTSRLNGTYDINITGTAATSNTLTQAEGILSGIINANRLSGNYNINITGQSNSSNVSLNVIGGIASVTELKVSGISTLAEITGTEISVSGISSFGPTSIGGTATISGPLNVTGIITSSGVQVNGDVEATEYYGSGLNLVGIVTQVSIGVGLTLTSTQNPGKGAVTVGIKTDIGKTYFVSIKGNDNNTGLVESDAKRTIKEAARLAQSGDTIKVFPGTYVEDNPITLRKNVSIEGAELRNCLISPENPGLDLFHVNNGCHLTDLSFVGPPSINEAAVVAFQPLLGFADNRFFDGSRLIRQNIEFISNEAVGFLTSGYSGFAGGHLQQDAARLIDLNINFIAAETVGFLTASSPAGYGFTLTSGDNQSCLDDVKDIFRAVSYDLKSSGNAKSVGAGFSYFDNAGALQHVVGIATRAATVAALEYAAGISTYVINNLSPPNSYQILVPQTFDLSVINNPSLCIGVGNTIKSLVGIITNMIGSASTSVAPAIQRGVDLDTTVCARDVGYMLKAICHDITRGGNSKCVAIGKSYYDESGNPIFTILNGSNPNEYEQTVATFDYAFNVARAVVNNVPWGGYAVGVGTTVVNALYNSRTGVTTITAFNHGLSKNDPVKIVGLGFTCPSGPGIVTYPSGAFGYTFGVKNVIDSNTFEVVVGQSTLPHTYVSGGTVQKYRPFQNKWTQIRDLATQPDPVTGFNDSINSCVNVISAIRSCIGVVTSIVGAGFSALRSGSNPTGIRTTYPGNSGLGTITQGGAIFDVSNAVYNNLTGITTITAPGAAIRVGDNVKLEGLVFECTSGGPISTAIYPSGNLGYTFNVINIECDNPFNVTNALYDNATGITTITAPGIKVAINDIIELKDLEFSCLSGAGTTTIYPTGNSGGFEFGVLNVSGSTFTVNVGPSTIAHTYVSGGTATNKTKNADEVFTVNVGVSTLAHTYVSGGKITPPYSPGVGIVDKGPYIRNCTNFIPNSIGLKADGFNAEPGDEDEIGVQGAMSVDSYTQFNQGGIGVSISNCSYCQLVSIFTIACDKAIVTQSGGQCDLTNSNSSFGNFGLYSKGVGDSTTKTIYRYSGVAHTDAQAEQDVIVISGIGTNRPYDGQALYFGELYYDIETIEVTDGGSGYVTPPEVSISTPPGPNGIRAEASANIDENGKVVSINIVSSGSQYLKDPAPSITFSGGGGIGATATANLRPLYYKVQSATLPVAGITTVVLAQNLNNTVGTGTTVYFSRLSLQIATTISFEYVGSGTNINTAKPAKGGVTRQENEVFKVDGGQVVYTSTDQAGNFRIGDDLVINQLTGTVSGRAFSQSLLNTVTPLLIALGR